MGAWARDRGDPLAQAAEPHGGTPLRRSHFLASLVLTRLAFLRLKMLALLGFAWWAFGARNEGNVAGLTLWRAPALCRSARSGF